MLEIGTSVVVKPVSQTLDDERTHPNTPDRGTFQHHFARYEFVLRQMRGDETLLDTGCGVGYGVQMLVQKTKEAFAVDYSLPALTHAAQHYGAPNLHYAQMDCHSLALASSKFDVVVSLEMFEHLEKPTEYLSDCHRVLRPGGRLYLSTPNRAAWKIHMRSIGAVYDFHVNMVDLAQLRGYLNPVFRRVEIYGQRRRGNSLHTLLRSLDIWNLRLRLFPPSKREHLQRAFGVPEGGVAKGEDWIFSKQQLRQCNHFVAICTK